MPAGRKPKPTVLKVLAGNPGKRPLNEREPNAPSGVPDFPAAFLQGEAMIEWHRIIPQLQAMGILSTVDRAAIIAYCVIWADFVDATENVRKFGKVVKAPSGYPIPSPYVSIARQAREDLRKYAGEFGLTPSSRSRVKVGTPAAHDPMEEFLKGPQKKQPQVESADPETAKPTVN